MCVVASCMQFASAGSRTFHGHTQVSAERHVHRLSRNLLKMPPKQAEALGPAPKRVRVTGRPQEDAITNIQDPTPFLTQQGVIPLTDGTLYCWRCSMGVGSLRSAYRHVQAEHPGGEYAESSTQTLPAKTLLHTFTLLWCFPGLVSLLQAAAPPPALTCEVRAPASCLEQVRGRWLFSSSIFSFLEWIQTLRHPILSFSTTRDACLQICLLRHVPQQIQKHRRESLPRPPGATSSWTMVLRRTCLAWKMMMMASLTTKMPYTCACQ